jgi:dihydroflavonol-4-reductase
MILLTGATGIVGHYIAEYILEAGHNIKALKRENSDISRLAKWGDRIEWVNADLDDLTMLKQAFNGIDRVVHCAALVSFHQQDKEEMMRINVDGTANMVNLAIEYRIEKFIYISSVAALGRKTGLDVIDETNSWEESDSNSNYAESKHLAEMEVWRGQEEGLTAVILNPSIVIGPGKWDSSSMQVFKYVDQERKFYPPGDMNYVDVRDVADIAVKMLFNEICGERFILNSGQKSYLEVFETIAKYLNKPSPRIKVSYALLTFAYMFDSFKSFITGQKSIITKESLKLSKMSFFYSNEKIANSLNYKFRSLDDAVAWTSEVIKKEFSS